MDVHKCYNCGKNFKDEAHLDQHKKRKTPCLIREVPPDQINNPNRCIFCNKILSKKEHLIRHVKTCKIKNGGMEILVDKVKYEQEIRILKEQAAVATEQNKMLLARMEEMQKKIEQLADRKLETSIINHTVNAPVINNATTINNSTNINNASIININLNSYRNPDISSIKLTVEELLRSDGNFYKFILEKVYFNPGLPENHSVYVPNKKETELIVYDNCWEYIREDGKLYEVVKQIVDTIHKSGTVLQGQLHDILDYHDVKFLKLPPAIQYMFSQFNSLKFEGEETLYDTAISRRDIVGPTIKESGCKLIK